MRDIKFEYIEQHVHYGTIEKVKLSLYEIENGLDGVLKYYTSNLWKLVSKRQYTEKIDKNKVEIYQGDIVKLNNELFIVSKLNSAFGFIKIKDGDFYEYMCNLCDMCGKVYEVVGNIYENKELLSKE